jgi:GDP-L-fucose synthase
MRKDSRIFVAGHRGLVGSALVRRLRAQGYENLILRTRQEVDLTDGRAVDAFFEAERPDHVFLAAARVGGILANASYPADFIRENLLIQTHVIDGAWRAGVKKLLFLGSSCIYPKFAEQPIREESFLTGALEPTNDAYAAAKIAGIIMCQAYRRQHGFDAIAAMPTNLYGPGDNFDPQNSHVLPGLMRRFHEAARDGAESVTVWGSGEPRREFLHVDDLAGACLFLMRDYSAPEILNIGCGEDVSIRELAEILKETTGFRGSLGWDRSKPDGTPRKRLDVSRMQALGWAPKIGLRQGVEEVYDWYRKEGELVYSPSGTG